MSEEGGPQGAASRDGAVLCLHDPGAQAEPEPDSKAGSKAAPFPPSSSSSSAAAAGAGAAAAQLLVSRGAHAWSRVRLADPVEPGRDLGAHLTRKGWARTRAEAARAALLTADGNPLSAAAKPL